MVYSLRFVQVEESSVLKYSLVGAALVITNCHSGTDSKGAAITEKIRREYWNVRFMSPGRLICMTSFPMHYCVSHISLAGNLVIVSSDESQRCCIREISVSAS